MKKLIVLVMICILSLSGCSYNETAKETAFPHAETDSPATKADPPPSSTTIAPSKTQSHPKEPSESEKDPPLKIVQPEPADDDFVKVITYIPDIFIDLRYSTEFNFTNRKIYDFSDVWLRYGTVKKLALVQEELKQSGRYLKIWDGFRPPSAQFKLWDICPDPTYVSNPNNGFSSHSRGNTVDVTLVNADGTELDMPTGFDDFSKLADRDYSDCKKEAAANAILLEELMKKHGFKPYSGEWWHFSDTHSYPVDEAFEPIKATEYRADCNEYISLRSKPDTASSLITKIYVDERFQVVAKHSDFALIEYNGLSGYVLLKYIQPVK